MLSDAEIARAHQPRPIAEIARSLAIPPEALIPFGHDKAKVSKAFIDAQAHRPDGRLILVTAINPTPAGEGKSTTTVGLGDALNRIGRKAAVALREPSLGPCFGMKGGATGGGYAQVVPMDQINLHFTGDLHAIGAAHNLLSAMVDNALHWGTAEGLDPRRVTWPRVMDLNDRALRNIALGLGGPAHGVPREGRFDITVASEVMAILCLARDYEDLKARLARIVVGETATGTRVTAGDLDAAGAMAALLKDAFLPNLVQTLEGTPAFVHGGPFANIAHGCNSVMATRLALKLADYVVTEAGFGADLGAEKFFDIKCRLAGLKPDVAVVVATVRALKMHGGVAKGDLGTENLEALDRGFANLERHVENLHKFGIPVSVAINRFSSDSDSELAQLREAALGLGVEAHICSHWADGGAGAEALAHDVVALTGSGTPRFHQLYPDAMPLADKMRKVATEMYGAADIAIAPKAHRMLERLETDGFGNLPVCMAKTPSSFSADPALLGAPSGHTVPIREVRLSAGAGFVVALCGDIMSMPGLPRVPAAAAIDIDADGIISGLF